MVMSPSEARDLAERSRAALGSLRKKMAAARENTSMVLGVAGHEVVGHFSLSLSSYLSGYFQQKLQFWGVDIRPVGGLLLQLGGLGAMLFGMPAGAYGVSIGRGPIGSWLAERSYVAGQRMLLPKEQRTAGQTFQIGADGHPMHRAGADATFTRSNRWG